MDKSEITKGTEIKDATGRWATVTERRDDILIVNKFWKFVHISNVIEAR